MKNYTGTITLRLDGFEADDEKSANEIVNAYLDHLISVLETNTGQLTWWNSEHSVEEE